MYILLTYVDACPISYFSGCCLCLCRCFPLDW
uniref:Uncharacterized protein n=1 Tax=Anguilla anguilla TaxID=7936 RepID=A0A0E9PBV7_ANGAN